MDTMKETADLPRVLEVPESISREQALASLAVFMPRDEISIEPTAKGNVRLCRNGKGLTVRPTLRECVGRVRWYYLDWMKGVRAL